MSSQLSNRKQKTKTVLLIGEFASAGGAKKYFQELLRFLTEQGFRVTQLVPSESHAKSQFHIVSSESDRRGEVQPSLIAMPEVGSSIFARNPISYFIESWRIRKFINGCPEKPDLILESVTSPGRFLEFSAQEIPVLQVLHSYPRGILHAIIGPLFGLSIRLSRKFVVIAVSSFLATEIRKKWWLSRKSSKVLTVVNTAGPGMSGKQNGASGAIPIVLTVGIANTAKAPLRFIEVARLYFQRYPNSNAVFRWVGDGPQLESARALVLELGLAERVDFVGHSSTPHTHYAESSIYLQLSNFDSMPLAALDAMRYSIPVLTTRVGGLPELLPGRLEQFSFEKNRLTEITSAINRLLSDPTFYSEISSEVLRQYEKKFSQRLWESQMNEIIQQTMELSWNSESQKT